MTTWQLDPVESGLRLVLDANTEPTFVSWRWLRDHGEDPASFDHDTGQRRVDALGPAPQPATAAAFRAIESGDALVLDWPEAPHSTWISAATLELLVAPSSPKLARSWRTADEVECTIGAVDKILTDDSALADWLGDLVTWGVARLSGFDGTKDQAQAISGRIGYVRETIFGGLWDLASDVPDHDDTAYSQTFLAPHTDGTYSHDAPGLQMFCCTARQGSGGQSIIVDGLAIAEDLERDFADHYELLTRVPIPGHYIEPGVELRACRPAIQLDPRTGVFRQISLNNYDRSPMLLAPSEMQAFYAAYGQLQRLADDQSRWLSIGLDAGDVLINDNWRVLHGRHAYTGERRFVGCYLNHEDFESRCRTLGIHR